MIDDLGPVMISDALLCTFRNLEMCTEGQKVSLTSGSLYFRNELMQWDQRWRMSSRTE